jgi:hypothetical protein
MKTAHGIWQISRGKGDRVYINCNDSDKVLHPEKLCDDNGLGLYGCDQLKSLAVAILKYEKAINDNESVMGMLNNDTE